VPIGTECRARRSGVHPLVLCLSSGHNQS
jgi:hypothetical protein